MHSTKQLRRVASKTLPKSVTGTAAEYVRCIEFPHLGGHFLDKCITQLYFTNNGRQIKKGKTEKILSAPVFQTQRTKDHQAYTELPHIATKLQQLHTPPFLRTSFFMASTPMAVQRVLIPEIDVAKAVRNHF
jgi:hypothetical protein